MKQLLIISGKGGTGKTTLATAFIKLVNLRLLRIAMWKHLIYICYWKCLIWVK